MSPRKLFNIILKIFGLLFIREIINAIPSIISSLLQYFYTSSIGAAIASVVISLLILAFYAFLAMQLLFKTNKIIDVLKLDQGFRDNELSFGQGEEFAIHLSSTTIFTIALIVIGGVILVDEIPDFCRQFYLYVNQSNNRYNPVKPDPSYMIFSAIKIIIALLLIGERKRIIDFIESRKSGNSKEENVEP
ncbi:MAG: hypothetical protein QM802_21300 [Agriterribacter sp.]